MFVPSFAPFCFENRKETLLSPIYLASGEEISRRYSSHVSKYDLATPDDLLFTYMLSPLVEPQPADRWTILKDLRSQVGDWVDDALASKKIAGSLMRSRA